MQLPHGPHKMAREIYVGERLGWCPGKTQVAGGCSGSEIVHSVVGHQKFNAETLYKNLQVKKRERRGDEDRTRFGSRHNPKCEFLEKLDVSRKRSTAP